MNVKQNDESKLSQSEAIILKDIERDLHCTLRLLEDYEVGKQGYQIQDSHIVTLNLQKIGLKVVPTSVGELAHLKNLILEGNLLKNIDFSIFKKCNRLGYINLRNNQISQVDLSTLQSFKKFESLILSKNQLRKVDLSPLASLFNLSSLSLDGNKLETMDLSFLTPESQLTMFTLHENPVAQLDITPLLSLQSIAVFDIDPSVHLTATPLHRDYSLKHDWFLFEHLPSLQWLESITDTKITSLFEYYNIIMKNFRHDEFWADFRDRRLNIYPDCRTDVAFFDFAVQSYLKIKEKEVTVESQDDKVLRRMNIEQQVQGSFLSSSALLPHLKSYFEVSNEPTVAVEDYHGDNVLYHYWLGKGPTQLPRVQTISWVQIHPEMEQESYHISQGFNRGYYRHQKIYHPLPRPSKFHTDTFETTEARIPVRSVDTSDPCKIFSESLFWLADKYHVSFDPDDPFHHYRSLGSKSNF